MSSATVVNRPRVVVSCAVPEKALDLLRRVAEVKVLEVLAEERPDALQSAEGLLCSVSQQVTDDLLSQAPNLRIVANMAVGYDNIDVGAAARRGVTVTNTPGVLSDTTAEFALALILGVLRRVGEADRYVRSGKWSGWAPDLFVGDDLAGSTVGIAGLGRIGTALAKQLHHGFGCRILYCAREVKADAEQAFAARRVSKDELLGEAKVVSLHLPLSEETHHWIGAEEFAAMREGAVLINTARGAVVDEGALVRALEDGRLFGAGLDVFEREPHVHPVLRQHPRVVLAPHIGSASHRTRRRMAELAARNLVAVLQGEAALTPIRLPSSESPDGESRG